MKILYSSTVNVGATTIFLQHSWSLHFLMCSHKTVLWNQLWSPSGLSHIWRLKGPSPSKASLSNLFKERHIWLAQATKSSKKPRKVLEIDTLLWSPWGVAQSSQGSGSDLPNNFYFSSYDSLVYMQTQRQWFLLYYPKYNAAWKERT